MMQITRFGARLFRIRNVVAAGLLAMLLPLPAAAQGDPDLLTGLTFNDGVRDLPIEQNVANSSGFGGPGTYMVHVPPGIRRVTVTPTWTNSQISGVPGTVRDITYGKDMGALSWSGGESGQGKVLELKRGTNPPVWGNGSTQLTLRLSGGSAVNGTKYRILLTHNGDWEAANDRLKRLAMRTSGNGQQQQSSGGGAILLGTTAATPGDAEAPLVRARQSYAQQAAASSRTAVVLDPPFNDEIYAYTARVPSDVTQVTVDVAPSDPSASVTVNGGPATRPVPVSVGENRIEVVVTAEDSRYRRTYTVTVTREAAAPLTASFEDVPDEHGGKAFTFRVRLSEAVGNFSKSPRASSFDVKQGRVRNVKQVEGGLWQVRVRPSSWRTVEVTLAGGRGCDEAGAVCTPDGRPLSNTVSAKVRGKSNLKVAGGRAKEGKPIDFAVTLNRASSGTVTVDYATEDETATAGSDYVAASGTLAFVPGETEKVVRVETLADTVSEGKEVFRLRLSNASSGARIEDGKAAGWINNVAAGQTAGDRAPGKVVDTEEAQALAIAGELSPEDVAGALLGGSGLEEKRLEALDRLGNGNGHFDVGDLLAWIERCRNGGARCGEGPRTPPSAAALPAAIAVGAVPRRLRRRAPRGRVRRRRRTGVLTVLFAATLWSCDPAGGPTAAIAPEPGYLAVELTAPAGGPDAAGALVEIDGPGIGEVRAPGLDVYAAEEGSEPRRFVLAGGMRTGPVLEFQVPDRNLAASYSVRVVEVAGEDHRLLEPDDYRAAITPH
ncbi:MAG: cadherin-like beta sandwich domain-containing protein [Gammaproteobacteria bacterium]|nr:cadherin-like beta sandwich domain-containing protein [Gammaproteobacteria bacterium]